MQVEGNIGLQADMESGAMGAEPPLTDQMKRAQRKASKRRKQFLEMGLPQAFDKLIGRFRALDSGMLITCLRGLDLTQPFTEGAFRHAARGLLGLDGSIESERLVSNIYSLFLTGGFQARASPLTLTPDPSSPTD